MAVLLDEFYLAPWYKFRDLEFIKTITESLQTLRRLELSIMVSFEEYPDPLGGICDWLEAISGRNKLESIEIYFYVTPSDYELNDTWHRLEEVLIKSGWPDLKCISITVASSDESGTVTFERAPSLDTQYGCR